MEGRWRAAKRQQGLKAVTLWLTTAEELRLKDLAATAHSSPSQVRQQALAQFHPTRASAVSPDTDGSQLRLLLQDVLREVLPGMAQEVMRITETVAETATATVTETEAPGGLAAEDLARFPPGRAAGV